MVQRYDRKETDPELVPVDDGRFVSFADYSSVEADLAATRKQVEDIRNEARKQVEDRVEAIKVALAELDRQRADIEALRRLLTSVRSDIDALVPRPPPPGMDDLRAAFESFASKLQA